MRAPLPRPALCAALLATAAVLAPGSAHAWFGAIAYSAESDKHGYSWNQATRAAAEQVALRECRTISGMANDCRVVVWYQNACGALATGRDRHYGWAAEPTEAQAAGRAMSFCRDRAGDSCRVARVVCSNR
jgi:hypothetical protein